MITEDNDQQNTGELAGENNPRTGSTGGDLKDSPHDEERMQGEEVILDLPDVSDIPGQEHILPPQMESFADTTISSDDEEGEGLFEDDETDEDTDLIMGTEADVSEEEKITLQRADEDMPTIDDARLRASALDNEDFEGDPLNEAGLGEDVSGGDIDTAVADDNMDLEALGQGDEENQTFSLGSDNNDNLNEGTP
ncbi:MAG TPA: hypothetical protein VF622_01655 [Segetibacter sp.]|jgi:hypothetical protein